MIKMEPNQELFNKHVSEISKSVDKLITKVLKKKLYSKERMCLEYIQNNLIDIIKADDEKMKYYIIYFKKHFPNVIGKPNEKEKNWTIIYKLVRKGVFEKEYDNWGQRNTYGAYYFVDKLELKTCPYCNRNYTFIVNEKTGKLRPEIDHFHPKSLYPFLAMSFYNLIPSCSTCNHTKKNKNSIDLLSPYKTLDSSYKFTYTPNDINFIEINEEKYGFENFEISLTGNNKNLEVFQLIELYKQHKDVVLELLLKRVYYPKSYIIELQQFGFSKEEIYRYIVCNYSKEEDFHKRPLSKLTKDISKELGLI